MAIAKKPSKTAPPSDRGDEKAIAAFIAGGGATKAATPDEVEDETESNRLQTTIRWDRDLLKRIDRAAKRSHTNRNAWVHMKLSEILDEEDARQQRGGRRD